MSSPAFAYMGGESEALWRSALAAMLEVPYFHYDPNNETAADRYAARKFGLAVFAVTPKTSSRDTFTAIQRLIKGARPDCKIVLIVSSDESGNTPECEHLVSGIHQLYREWPNVRIFNHLRLAAEYINQELRCVDPRPA